MKTLTVLLLVTLTACASMATLEAERQAEMRVARLEVEYDAERVATGQESMALAAELEKAKAELETAKANASASKVGETAQRAGNWLAVLGPLIGLAFPPAMALVSGLQAILGGIVASRKQA